MRYRWRISRDGLVPLDPERHTAKSYSSEPHKPGSDELPTPQFLHGLCSRSTPA